MSRAILKPLRLYAVIPGEEEDAPPRVRRVGVLRWGAIAVIVGPPPTSNESTQVALWHDRIVSVALSTCSAVVPFRLGVDVRSEADVYGLLRLNADELLHQLLRFRGRVEMGLRALVAPRSAKDILRIPFGIDRVRKLAREPMDRHERLSRGQQGRVFEGCYLISRQAIDDFWSALESIRQDIPQVPLLGSGPWAPYSFCNAPLRRAIEETQVPLARK